MPTDDERGDTDASGDTPPESADGPATAERTGEASRGDPPRIEDDPGSADEWFARAILITPFFLLLVAAVGVAVLVWTGQVGFDVTIDGSISIGPLVYGFAVLVGLSYVLAAAKEWGVRPVMWIANAARNYRPREDE